MILRLIEIYENNSETIKGKIKFYQAWIIAYTYNFLVNKKKYNSAEIQARNILMYRYRRNPLNNEVQIKQQIENDYTLITEVLDSVKEDSYKEIEEYDIDRSKIAGCIGTVIY